MCRAIRVRIVSDCEALGSAAKVVFAGKSPAKVGGSLREGTALPEQIIDWRARQITE